MKIQQLENEKQTLQKDKSSDTLNNVKFANFKLEKQLELYKINCPWTPPNIDHNDGQHENTLQKFNKDVDRSFDSQILVSEHLYKIPMKLVNHTTASSVLITNINNPNNNLHEKTNEIGNGDGGGVGVNKLVAANLLGGDVVHHNDGLKKLVGVVINSVENFQMIPQPLMDNSHGKDVLAQPPPIKLNSSTVSTNKVSAAVMGEKNNQNELLNAPLPTATLGNKLKISSTTAANKNFEKSRLKFRQVPEGVVPVPPNVDDMMARNDDVSENNRNDRYKSVLDEVVGGNGDGNVAAAKKLDTAADDNKELNSNDVGNDIDNGAHEVVDDFLMDNGNHKDHLQAVLDDNKLNGNNAAEDDTNLYEKSFNLAKVGQDDDDLQVVHKNDKLANNKLMNEIDADQGKVAAYPDEMRIEEAMEEGDGNWHRLS